MSHHVSVRLPDGRDAMADYRQPVARVMQRVLSRVITPAPGSGKADAADLAIISTWLDEHPEQACSPFHCALHGPAFPGYSTLCAYCHGERPADVVISRFYRWFCNMECADAWAREYIGG